MEIALLLDLLTGILDKAETFVAILVLIPLCLVAAYFYFESM